jgi:hypothetical protein
MTTVPTSDGCIPVPSPLTAPSGSQEGGNEPSCRAIGAEFETIGPIPTREARGPFLANSSPALPHLGDRALPARILDADLAVNTHGVRVNSRAELEEHFRASPLKLRAARSHLPKRPGHPDFVGPVPLDAQSRVGALQFDNEGSTSFTIRKKLKEEARDARILRWLGDS